MPPITATPKRVTDWFTQDAWDKIFPYSKASSCFTHDNMPFWRRDDFIAAIRWMNQHKNQVYHNFCEESSVDHLTNVLELCAFLANTHQETGDPSLTVPYPWGWPPAQPKGADHEGPGGGCLAICEGVCAVATFGTTKLNGFLNSTNKLSQTEKGVLDIPDDEIHGAVMDFSPANQPNFGLGAGTGAGAVFQPGLVAVADDGTVYGDEPQTTDPTERALIRPSSEVLGKPITNRKYAAHGMYGRYGGRGAIQLSYNYNYSECSLALFGDYRLARFPNLITTTDRENWMGKPEYFGFPGPNRGGANKLPQDILTSTPPARILAWATCLWFWMDRNRSGRKVSCHQAMMAPWRMGITTCNMIVNNDSGCSKGWAWNKNRYYERICKIMGVESRGTIICPPAKEALQN